MVIGNAGKESLDLIEPAGVGGSEMEMPAWMLGKPSFHRRRFMRGIVVEHRMNFQFRRHGAFDLAQERQELARAMLAASRTDDLSAGHFQGSEKTQRAMPIVIVGPTFGLTGPEGQNGLAALQSLHLRLLIHAEDQGIL